MGRKQNDAEPGRYATLILLLIAVISCTLVYTLATVAFGPGWGNWSADPLKLTGEIGSGELGVESGECCRGIDNLELWGPAVKWGSDFKFNSSVECCKACKAMCGGNDGPCLCDTWVHCGSKEACGSKFGEVSWFHFLFVFLNLVFQACVGYLLDFGAHSEAVLYSGNALWWGLVIERQSGRIIRTVLGDAKWRVNSIGAVLCR